MLPGLSGLDILRKSRALRKKTHVLILSAKDQVEDRVRGLELEVDDYMIKPFSFDELNARINTLMRRKFESKNPVVAIGPIEINTATKEIYRDGDIVRTTPGECFIFEYLVLNRGRVLSKEQFLEAMHDSDSFAGTNVIEVLVCKLCGKIGTYRDKPIISIRMVKAT